MKNTKMVKVKKPNYNHRFLMQKKKIYIDYKIISYQYLVVSIVFADKNDVGIIIFTAFKLLAYKIFHTFLIFE